MNKFNLLGAIVSIVFIANVSYAQSDYINNNISSVNTSEIVAGGPGVVLGSFVVDAGISATPVGLENDGSGNLLGTALGNDEAFTIDTTGTLIGSPTSVAANSGTPIGISTDGTNIYITDTADDDVDVYDNSYNYISSIDVSGTTTFPEGVTYSEFDGNLYVVDGTGGNIVAQYDLSGNLLNTFPIDGSSQDGIAVDYQRCVFWVYDSGTDTARSYDSSFNALDTFPGTAAAGFSNGEGVGVIGDSLYIMATGSATVVEFDISNATAAANAGTLCNITPAIIPTLSKMNLLLMTIFMLLVGGILIRKMN